MTCNLHEIIRRYTLPVARQNEPVIHFLSKYYDRLLKELTDSAKAGFDDFPGPFYQKLEADIIPKMKDQCRLIAEVLEFDQARQYGKKFEKFDELMQMLRQYGALRYISTGDNTALVRIRKGEGPYERKNLFHIPYHLRASASAQRFSIPGTPALYLSIYPGIKLLSEDAPELSWIECGMPRVYHVCLFQPQQKLNFLHLAKKGTIYLWEYDNANCEERKEDRMEAIEQYLLTLPLRIACFIGIEDRFSGSSVYYYEEYVISQLLTEWIQQSTRFDGLAYQSASMISDASNHDSYNVVIPTGDFDADNGYDKRLTKIFKLSEPEKINISERMKGVEDKISEVYKYTKKLKAILAISNASGRHPYRRLAALCDSFCSIHTVLKNGKESSIAFPFQQLDTLCQISILLSTSISNVRSADEWIRLHKGYEGDTTLTENDTQIILEGFCNASLEFQVLRNALYPKLTETGVFGRSDYQFIV